MANILNPARRSAAEFRRNDWIVDAEEGTTVQDVLDPGYWAHCAADMSIYDRIDVRLETGEWLLELFVLDVGRNYARVFLAHKHDFSDVSPVESIPQALTHKIMWKGPHLKHVVVRLADGAALQTGFSDRAAAVVWLDNHLKVSQA